MHTSGFRTRLLLAGAVLALTPACSTGHPGRGAESAPPSSSASAEVRQDVAALHRRFPELGELSAARWVGTVLGAGGGSGANARLDVPGPSDVGLDGVARVEPAALASITASGTWQEGVIACPVPGPLAAEVGSGSTWLHSEAFDRTVTRDQYPGSFYFERRSSRVYFCTVNPTPRSTE
ncbi:hypothetical protein ACIRS1_25880 [Kitasatospora sp. NPDC101176]|uniref:hypothetical protein n=1 Tax=Kitasatospora sp. NPDC101176 TaxID=3364099 RepID=UPI00382899A1